MLLGSVLAERGNLALDVGLDEGEVRLVGEVEVVPGDLVTEDGRTLERAQAFRRITWWSWWMSCRLGWKTASGRQSSQSATNSSRMSCRCSGNVRTSKSCTVRFSREIPSSAVASSTSRARVSGGKPSGSDLVAIENAT